MIPGVRIDHLDKPPHERPAVYWDRHQSKWIFRAYAIGSCPLKLALIATGREEEFSASTLRTFALGHKIEAFTKTVLREESCVISNEQREISWDLGAALICGHWDGEIEHSEFGNGLRKTSNLHEKFGHLVEAGWDLGPCVLEVKGLNEESTMSFLASGLDAFPQYRQQVRFYSAMTELPILFAVMCKSDLSLHLRYYPAVSRAEVSDLLVKVARVLSYIADLESGAAPLCVDFSHEKYRCPFEDRHDEGVTQEDVAILDGRDDLEAMAREYVDLGRESKEIQSRRDELKSVLSTQIAQSGARKVKCGKHSWQEIATTYKDYSALLRDHPQVAASLPAYERTSSYLRIDGPRQKNEKKAEV